MDYCPDKVVKDLVVPTLSYFWPFGLCFKYPDRVDIRGNAYVTDFSNQYIYVVACDKDKRSTCKPRKQIVEFVQNTNFYVLIQNNQVLVDKFEMTEKDKTNFRGDAQTYFPIDYGSNPVFWGPLKIDDEDRGVTKGTNFFISQNELTIEDDMFYYGQRSTKFFNLNKQNEVSYSRRAIKVGKELSPFPDVLYHFSFQLDQSSKSYSRTRRKIWDDISTRGGQYSSAIIVMTAIYTLLQWPFTEMVLGLKFAQMRQRDSLSSYKE